MSQRRNRGGRHRLRCRQGRAQVARAGRGADLGGSRLIDCAIIVPAFNEERSVGRVVEGLRAFGTVIVVDDASVDETAARATEAGAVTLVHEENLGYGLAIETGLREAVERGCRYAVTIDGDGQHEQQEVEDFIELVRQGRYDLVVGIRPGPLRLAERLCSWYTRRSFGVEDPLCGFKAYNLRLFSEYGSFDRHRSVGTELVTYAIRHGARWTQRPITLHGRDDGHSRFYASVRGNVRILRALWAMLRVR